MPPAAMASRVTVAMASGSGPPVRRCWRRHSSTRPGRGNLGAGPKPPHSASKRSLSSAVSRPRATGKLGTSGSAAGPDGQPVGHADVAGDGGRQGVGLALDLGAPLGPGLVQGGENPAERGHAVALGGRVVGAAEERSPVGGAKDRHRPAARAADRLHGGHVDGVEVGALLAVDLDGHEVSGELGGRLGILEALVGHDVAPVAAGVADGDEDGLVLGRRRARGPRDPTGTSRPGCRRADGGTGLSRRPAGSPPGCYEVLRCRGAVRRGPRQATSWGYVVGTQHCRARASPWPSASTPGPPPTGAALTSGRRPVVGLDRR